MKKAYGESPLAVTEKEQPRRKTAAHSQHRPHGAVDPARLRRRRLPGATGAPNPEILSWRHVTACEARNALQVILSGAEILLDHQAEALTAEQQMLLERMSDNALHLANLICALAKIDERSNPEDAAALDSLQALARQRELAEL